MGVLYRSPLRGQHTRTIELPRQLAGAEVLVDKPALSPACKLPKDAYEHLSNGR